MQKIRIIVDTPADIPDEDLARLQIDMASVPIVVDGKEYWERKSFSIREFYGIMENASEMPVTSRVPAADFAALYRKNWEAGYTDIIVVTINAGGSGTHDSARMAVDLFFSEHPEAVDKLHIHLVDSRTYAVGYGYPAMQAAEMALQGRTVPEILDYLHDYFDRLEIYLACYTLEYAKKSGRITAAAAFVGDVLGLRPIIAMIDGTTRTSEKVRGDKQVVGKLLDIYKRQRVSPDDPVMVVSGSVDAYGDELQALLQKELGREVPKYHAGASIVINAGPKIAAVTVLGKKRKNR